jgi:hypothetical protein
VRKVKGPDGKVREVEEGTDSVRSGVTLPYSPEFMELESNTGLLERIREMTAGKSYEDDQESLEEAVKRGEVFRAPEERSRFSLPFHYWLLFLAAGLLLVGVAVRRLAFDPEQTAEQARYVWARLRGLPVPPPAQREAVLRLRARPGAVTTGPGGLAAQRFEGGPGYTLPAGVDASDPTRPQAPRPVTRTEDMAPQIETPVQEGGGLENLLEAKKRVWEEKKDKPEGS